MNDIASNNIDFHVSHSKRLWYSLGGIPLCLPKVILNKFQFMRIHLSRFQPWMHLGSEPAF